MGRRLIRELDFEIDGRRFRLNDAQRGIRKPAELDDALSIRTVFRPEGATRPDEDSAGPDNLFRYKWRGEDPDHPENRALRAAMVAELPLIWFFGVGSGMYKPVFRATIMRAYETRCAVCALAHTQLLDAAHIIPDNHELGVASVRNGLALCKIHHAAYDSNILGIRPDLVVQIKSDLLDEVDGPMLQYGLKERHNQNLMVLPKARAERPGTKFLEDTTTPTRPPCHFRVT